MSESAAFGALESFAEALKAKFSARLSFQPEEQLKGPVAELLEQVGQEIGLTVTVASEVRVEAQHIRPDLGVMVDSLLTGHVELKAPGKGANPARFQGHDREQWKKLQNLPNLLYTDGNDWALYRSGKRQGALVRLNGDVTTDGKKAITPSVARELFSLLSDFLTWQPVVPTSPRALAALIAPLCRLLREEVLAALQRSNSNLSALAADWRKYFFPQADDLQFADAYAQTLTYALLLARFSEAGAAFSVREAEETIRPGHQLLAEALRLLADPKAYQEIETPIRLLERVIGAVNPALLQKKAGGDLWLYFYEDFLAVYDPKLRKDRGVYYTPVEVVQAQIRLVAELLGRQPFHAPFSFVEPNVLTLDPAAGTGTYILAALEHGLEQIAQVRGEGMRANAASQAARNLYAFELLVGPYAVAHLRLTQRILAEGGQLPEDGVHVYLTDTLESPHRPPPQFPFAYKELAEEHRRAQKVKADTPILVCLGNPPYDRQQIAPHEEGVKRKGGWVRYGDPQDGDDSSPLLADFIKPLEEQGLTLHAKNLYNDYVYFWRWALWKVFESQKGPGIVSFITAASYLRGPGFAGMRKVMRETFDEMWIIDLEGDNLGARKTENVFAIRTPVAIAIGVRYGPPQPDNLAKVHYVRLSGTREEKLQALANVRHFSDLRWRPALSGKYDPFLPTSDKPYWDWPRLTDLFPWQTSGLQFKRTWPIAPAEEVLRERWKALLKAPDRRKAFKETRDRKIDKSYPSLEGQDESLVPIAKLPSDAPCPPVVRYAYRSFDRQWVLMDNRLGDYLRPDLLRAHGKHQVYLTSLLTNVLGTGPAAVATALLPDLHHFRGSFGGRHVIPLWRDREARWPNITVGLLARLAEAYGRPVAPEDLLAYAYAILASPAYVERFWDELTIPGPRLPLTKDADLFAQAVEEGRRLLWLHTFGERFVPEGETRGRVPPGKTRCRRGTPATPEAYPETFGYDAAAQELHVGAGLFAPVSPQVWEFSVSGLQVVKSWLRYRMRKGAGRRSSPLDEIRPTTWTFDAELLDLLWVLEATVARFSTLEHLLEQILAGALFRAEELPQPSDGERRARHALPLFDEQG